MLTFAIVPHKAAAEVSKIGSFKDRTLWEKGVLVTQGWQSKSTDGPKGDWSYLERLQWLQWSPHPQVLDVVWCSAAVAVVVV